MTMVTLDELLSVCSGPVELYDEDVELTPTEPFKGSKVSTLLLVAPLPGPRFPNELETLNTLVDAPTADVFGLKNGVFEVSAELVGRPWVPET